MYNNNVILKDMPRKDPQFRNKKAKHDIVLFGRGNHLGAILCFAFLFVKLWK